MGIHGPYGLIWADMGPYGPIWSIYGSIQTHPDACGSIWTHPDHFSFPTYSSYYSHFRKIVGRCNFAKMKCPLGKPLKTKPSFQKDVPWRVYMNKYSNLVRVFLYYLSTSSGGPFQKCVFRPKSGMAPGHIYKSPSPTPSPPGRRRQRNIFPRPSQAQSPTCPGTTYPVRVSPHSDLSVNTSKFLTVPGMWDISSSSSGPYEVCLVPH